MQPQKAVTAADRLLHADAGGRPHGPHAEPHLPARGPLRRLSIRSNELAVAADEDYITQCRAQGMYPMAYYPHNVHFLWWSTTYDGQSAPRARGGAQGGRRHHRPDARGSAAAGRLPRDPVLRARALRPLGRGARAAGTAVDQPVPDRAPGTTCAVSRSWRRAGCRRPIASSRRCRADGRQGRSTRRSSRRTPGAPCSPSGPRCWRARLPPRAVTSTRPSRHLERAVRLEDGLVYTEPAEWHYPPRQALGAVLLAAGPPGRGRDRLLGRPAPEPRQRVVALRRVAGAASRRARPNQAARAEARFKQAWARADVTLEASRFGAPATQPSRASGEP